MPFTLFQECLDKALQLDVGLVSFLGGEPTLWRHLEKAVSLCSKNDVCTDITTNGSTLSQDYLERLAGAGLDLLNISVDGLSETEYSKKCYITKPGMIDLLQRVSARSGMRVRINSVICKGNFDLIKELLQLSKQSDIPISLGFAMSRSKDESGSTDIHFGLDDLALVEKIVAYVLAAKAQGTKVIDPDAYFLGFERFLRGEEFWQCNYATRRGWVNIDPYGELRDCTKKFGRIGQKFVDIERTMIPALRGVLARGVGECNADCYSNCAFDGAYYAKHKFQFLYSGVA